MYVFDKIISHYSAKVFIKLYVNIIGINWNRSKPKV